MGYDPTVGHIDKKEVMSRNFDAIVQPSSFTEIDVPNTRDFSLGIKYYYNNKVHNISSLYIKYHDLTKRKFFWNIWEKGRSNYKDYTDFKEHFNPNTPIFSEIAKETKKDLRKEISDLLSTNSFQTKGISLKDIKNITTTISQNDLNIVAAKRNGGITISNPRRYK